MQKIETAVEGCYILQPRAFSDHRGRLVKTFHEDTFKALGLETHYPESYYSVSNKGVLRGLHFQVPPYAQVKLVTCVYGRLLDVAVDLRTDSPTYGKHVMVELSAEQGNMLYMPEGLAHGFYALTDQAIIQYFGSTMYHPESDGGVAWDSCGIAWPDASPVVSEKDAHLPAMTSYESPFRMPVSV
ncbi:MAG: dTDP-4-dehydrorhamnose 3,5-epimerase [Bacteroidetes bacterium]|nr:MAG: dTDP-4-dehydrorhamnose 3,5-epimerase [Bacteroidota bacterium]